MIRTNAAATMLGVSASTLRSWERRYAFPKPDRSEGGHRHYELDQIQALRHALDETHNISSAISLARERGAGPPTCARLAEAFAAFDEQQADRQLEESLALRSLERTVEELLLPAVASQSEGQGMTPAFEFAWRHATGWLSAHKRLTPQASRPDGVLILDPWTPGEMETLHAQALELVLRRAGLRTLSLSPATDRGRLGRAIRALDPRAVVLCGHPPLDAVARLIYAVRSSSQDVIVFDYRGAVPDTGASTVTRLGDGPATARDRLIAELEAAKSSHVSAPRMRGARSSA
jgi:DNA-binding transcriptional MerR regulator